jgi:hypothetical protein
MYYYLDLDSIGGTVRHIFRYLSANVVQSFPDVDSNSGPERAAYLEWQAAGNVPQPWEG